MIIIWGTRKRARRRGCVADKCPSCGRPARFEVTDHENVPHLYGIQVWAATHLGSSRRCTECGLVLDCAPGDYEACISKREAGPLSLEELAGRTNAHLLAEIEVRKQLENKIARAGDAEHRDRAILELAVLRLIDLRDGSAAYEAIAHRLARWEQLAPAAKQAVVDDIRAFEAGKQTFFRTNAFMLGIASRRWKYVSHIAFFASMVLGMTLMHALEIVGGTAVWWFFASIPVSLVAGYLANRAWHLRWFARTVIPEGERLGVDFDLMLELLDRARTSKEEAYEACRSLAGNRGLLARALRRRSERAEAP